MKRTGPWSPERTTAFLRETTAPVRLACRTPNDDPWILSLWYEWVDGDGESGGGGGENGPELRCATSAEADVVRFLRADDAVAFEVSTNDPPYRGVRGRGTATVEPDEGKAQLRRLLERYLGGTENELADSLLRDDREEVRIRVSPARIHTWDYSDRMRGVGGDG